MRIRLVLLVIFAIALLASAQQATVPPAPAAPRHPVVDVYHGVHVSDDYRWLEDWNSPAVKQWSAAENRRTRAYLDQLPSREAIRKNFAEMSRSGSGQYYDLCQRKYLFAMKYQPPQQQPALVVMLGAGDPDSERVIIDPNRGGKPGASTIDFYVPSPDGKLVAASLSENGSEDGTAHVFEAATGKELADRVPRVNFGTGGGSIAWKADGSGFYYARYPQGNERPPADVNFYQQIYFHALGTPASEDQY
nr:S9 family peptidase [Terriglobales bacterium]